MEDKHARLIAELARDADACERSWSFGTDFFEKRVLLFFETTRAAARTLAVAAREMGLHDELIAAWSKALPGADAIGIAVSHDGRSVRLYVQYWLAVAAAAEAGRRGPTPLYVGFKSLPDGSTRRDIYHCEPLAPPEVFWPPMQSTASRFGLDEAALSDALAGLTAETAIFTRTEGHGRRSWLTTVRRAAPRSADVARWLAPLAKAHPAESLLDQARRRPLVHLAGGSDATKGDFMSVYFESDAEEVVRLGETRQP